MADPSPQEQVKILGSCVEILSEISRDPAVYGDAAAALALGTLCFLADPKKVMGGGATDLPDATLVIFAVSNHLAAKQVAALGLPPHFFNSATATVKPFLSRNQHRLVKAGQTFPVVSVLERARGRVEQQAAKLVGLEVPDLGPAPYQTLVGAITVNPDGSPSVQPIKPGGKPTSQPAHTAAPTPTRSAPPPAAAASPAAAAPAEPQPEAPPPGRKAVVDPYVLGDKDAELSTEDRLIHRGYTADRKTPVSLLELRSPWMLRDDYIEKLDVWVSKVQAVTGANVAKVLGIYRPPGKLFVVYELLDGQTLDRLLVEGALEEPEVFTKLEQIAAGLRSFHAAGLVHRGLRPDRILVDRSGTVKIFDPALPRASRPAGEEETLREKGLRGEVRYMSPEMCLGQEDTVASTDIYSLGLIVCEMLLGEQNLQRVAGEAVKFWLNWHVDLYKKAIPLNEIDGDISPELSDIVSKMLEKRAKNRYADVGQVLSELSQVRSGKKKAARPAPQKSTEPGGRNAGGRGLGDAMSNVQQMVNQAGIPPRTLALAAAVGVMFIITGLAIAWKLTRTDDGGGIVTPIVTGDDPCKKQVEEALVFFRREDFDGAAKQLDQLGSASCAGASATAANGLRRDIQKARVLKDTFKEAMRKAKEAESLSQTSQAILHYQDAAKSFKELSALIQSPDRPMPDDLAQRLGVLEPVRLLEEAKAALKNSDAYSAKTIVYRLLDNYPNSGVARDADEFAKKVLEVMQKQKVYVEQFDRGRESDAGGRFLDAAQSYWQAKLAYEDVQRLCGNPGKEIPPDLKDKLDQVYPKIWMIKTPQPDQRIVADELLVEISIPEKFFRELTIGTKSYPIKGDFVTFRIKDVADGNQILDVSATSIDGRKYARKVAFQFHTPTEDDPVVKINAISQAQGVIVVEITYNNETYTVEQGWKSPDGRFEVSKVTQRGITIQTRKRKKIEIPH
ncbi:MAG: serine/threonine protein kinase [Candidatus Riflebacteria bacterium]|nr:serine/threonine protein kinase [Candidatus Riflebacteria bacterium]